jgi:hypothetical protein
VFVVRSVLRLLQNPTQHLHGTGTDFLDYHLKLSALLAFDREGVPRGIYSPPITVEPRENGGSPLVGFPPERRKDPDRINLLGWNRPGDGVRQPIPPGQRLRYSPGGHAGTCSRRSV